MNRESEQNKIVAAIVAAASKVDLCGLVLKPVCSELAQILSESGQYAEFDEKLHTVADSAARFTFDDLATRLAKRSLSVAAETALSQLNAYVEADELHLVRLLLLHNIHINEDFTFSNGVQLLQIKSLPESRLRNILSKRPYDRFIGGHIYAVLAIDFVHKKRVRTDGDEPDWSIIKDQTRRTKILEDTRLILSLARHSD